MENIKFTYLYRDGGNYKSWAEVVFSNPADLSPSAVTLELRRAFMQDGLFIAHQIRIPEVLPYCYGDLTPDDHCFHELDSVELTVDVPNDCLGRSINEFLTEVMREALAGWRAFDPHDRLHSLEKVPQPSRHE
jgi:hypothetical protein